MFKQQSILCIIPARGGSKGIPGKNKKLLNGKPLIAYAIEAAKKSCYIDRVVVSTDDAGIARIAKKYGAEVPVMRPAKFAGDKSMTIDAIRHMLTYLKKIEGYTPDVHVLVQPTSPLVNAHDIDTAIETLNKTKSDACVSVCEISERPESMYSLNKEKLVSYLPDAADLPRQQYPALYRLNGAVYVTKVSSLIQHGFIPPNTAATIMPRERSIDIDTVFDFKIANFLAQVK